MNREAIYSALYAKLASVQGFTTKSRRLKHWTDVPAGDQPALYVIQRREHAQTVPGMPTVWTFLADVYVYVNVSSDQAPSQVMNPLMDAVVATISPDPVTNKQTLGGLVQHAWIEGEIETDEGVLGNQAVYIIPIRMKVV